MNPELTMLTGLNSSQRAAALRWLCRQAEEVRIEIMLKRFHSFHSLKKQHAFPAPLLDYCALILACQQRGWRAEGRYKSSRGLNDCEMKQMRRLRQAKARELSVRRNEVRDILSLHWGKVVELRQDEMGYRGIATYFGSVHNIRVSHMTIWKYWQEWVQHERIPNG